MMFWTAVSDRWNLQGFIFLRATLISWHMQCGLLCAPLQMRHSLSSPVWACCIQSSHWTVVCWFVLRSYDFPFILFYEFGALCFDSRFPTLMGLLYRWITSLPRSSHKNLSPHKQSHIYHAQGKSDKMSPLREREIEFNSHVVLN